jgi:hypothetical protein
VEKPDRPLKLTPTADADRRLNEHYGTTRVPTRKPAKTMGEHLLRVYGTGPRRELTEAEAARSERRFNAMVARIWDVGPAPEGWPPSMNVDPAETVTIEFTVPIEDWIPHRPFD